MKILIAGEINVDLILQGYASFPEPGREILVDDSSLTLGSASAICAAGLATLGDDVCFVGKVGCDSYGEYCTRALAAKGVDISRVVRDPAVKTGLTVSITSAKDRALVTHLGSIAALTEQDIPDRMFEGFRHLHVSSYFLQQGLRTGCLRLFERARAAGLTCSLDPGCDPDGRWSGGLRETVARADVFLPNEVELAGLTGFTEPEEAVASLRDLRTLTVAKLGGRGCIAHDGDRLVRLPVFPVQPVDTTGAGDSFDAGFLHCWLRGEGVERSLRFAAACGALSTLGLGGTASQATHEQAEAFLREHAVRQEREQA